MAMRTTSGMSAGLYSSFIAAVGHVDAIDDGRRGRDQVEIEFALQPLLNDFQMQQPQKAAAKAEAQRRGAFRLIGEARIVEMQFAQRLAQIFEQGGIDRKEAAEHHRQGRLEARQRPSARRAARR